MHIKSVVCSSSYHQLSIEPEGVFLPPVGE